MKPDLSIIVLNYNAGAILGKCLNSIRAQKGLALQVIVVDNHSTDGSTEMVAKDFPEAILVKRNTSVGFAAGNNAGLPHAQADLILFLNPDTELTGTGDLKRCVEKYKATHGIGVLTCRVNLVMTGGIDVTCHRGFPTPWASFTHFAGLGKLFPKTKLFGQYLQSYKGYDTEHEIDAAGGMFMLMDRSIGDQVGWWDEEYPLYGEDLDLCYRIKELGYKIMYWPGVTILHYKGLSTGMSKQSRTVSTASKATTRQVKEWSIKAMELFYRKHYRNKYPFFVNWLVLLGVKTLRLKRVGLA